MPTHENAQRELCEKVGSEAMAGSPIRCKDLTCRNCKFRYDDSNPERNGRRNGYGRMRGPTGRCEKYRIKPNKVLLGGECDKKETA